MLVGYARTSTIEQNAGFDAQLRELGSVGVEKIFDEQVSSIGHRTQLKAALDYIREGDVLVVTKLDRLARSIRDLLAIIDHLKAKGAALRILNMNLDTAAPTGQLMLTVFGGVAEFERQMMLERQREGIAKAKADGKYKGRKPTARMKSVEIEQLADEGMTRQAIAEKLNIGVASVYRALYIERSKKTNFEMKMHTVKEKKAS